MAPQIIGRIGALVGVLFGFFLLWLRINDSNNETIILYILLGAILAVIHFGIALWVYNDAKKRGHQNPIEWALATLIPTINIFGLIAYFYKRNPKKDNL